LSLLTKGGNAKLVIPIKS